MSFLGKEYAFEKQENFEELVNSLGLPAEEAKGFINFHPNQKLVKKDDGYALILHKEIAFKSGEPFEEKIFDRTSQTVFTLDGNTLTQEQKFDDGVNFKFVRVFSDDQLVTSVTVNKYNGGVAKRYYKAV